MASCCASLQPLSASTSALGVDLVLAVALLEVRFLDGQPLCAAASGIASAMPRPSWRGTPAIGGELPVAAGLLQRDPGREIGQEVARRRAEQVERVHAAALGEGAVRGVAEAERHRDDVGVNARIDVRRRFERAVRRGEPQDLAVPDVELARRLRTAPPPRSAR